jgi:hypothetical protein
MTGTSAGGLDTTNSGAAYHLSGNFAGNYREFVDRILAISGQERCHVALTEDCPRLLTTRRC